MNKHKLMDLIYDKLADNDEQEQFEHLEHSEEMCLVNDGEPMIAIVYDGVEYVISIKANKKANDWQVFEPMYSDREKGDE